MNDEERAALDSIRLDWAPVPDDVWRRLPYHVDGLHPGVVQAVRAGVREAAADADGNPIGLVLAGRRGSGKTHLLGWLRDLVQADGGYFFLVSLLSAKDFWASVLASMLDGLARQVPGGETQLRLAVRRLAARVDAPASVRRALIGETGLTTDALDFFIEGLAAFDEYVFRTSRETARALVLSVSSNLSHRDVADAYFACDDEGVTGERAAWGMRRAARTPEEIVQDLSRLLALTGPAVMAFDQIDVLLAQSDLGGDPTALERADSEAEWKRLVVLENVAGGLMTLRERTRRTLTVVACIPASWELIKRKATDTVSDRFREAPHLMTISSPDLAREIVTRRFAPYFEKLGFIPPYPTWPILPEAFQAAGDFTPRRLLVIIDAHIRACLVTDEVRELHNLGDPPLADPSPALAPPIDASALARYDERFDILKRDADVITPLEPDTEDPVMPELLTAGLTAWILERPEGPDAFAIDPPPSAKPDLHARLRLTLAEEIEDEVHWCFRAVSDEHHGNAALNRLRRAVTAAGLDRGVPKRKLFLLRNERWSNSPKTQQEVQNLAMSGGQTLPLNNEDLRILAALRTLLHEDPVGVRPWLIARQPATQLTLLREALGDVDGWLPRRAARNAAAESTGTMPAAGVDAIPAPDPAPVRADESSLAITVGNDYTTGAPVSLELEALRKHMTVFAGSGSGKTVLIRRMVEECALQGVSSIVLDPNNDLARLGDRWPDPPPHWGDGDSAKAVDYLEQTDVVVWTPRREAGRPLSFQPLPDFRAAIDDPDEFAEAVEAAVAALAPRAMLDSRAAKAHLGRAVLRRAVEYFGRRGGNRLSGLIDTLADLPDGVIDLDGAEKIAAGLAQTLSATVINDPLFGGTGTPADPGLLLTPTAGKRARVSVISFVGLPEEAARQSFVNQLQMALFTWIKKNPAVDRPLVGLLVMDEAQTLVPSGAMTACTQSTLALASQARKYGLGLVFATQAPRNLHNRVPGNAATQVYGLLNSPTQVGDARQMAKAKGGDVPDISRLRAGEFYIAVEGDAPRKIRAPGCLSYHPRSPLTAEEVIVRSRR
jgi:hypothetical protein